MTDFIKLAEGTELVSKRSENFKTFFAGIVKKDGKDVVKYRQEICIGALHYKDDYKDEKEQYKDIDLTWVNNKITTAPYILERIGNKIIVLDKKTGQTGTIELTDIGTSKISTDKIKDVKTKEIVKDVDVEIIPAPDSIRFQTVIKDPTALAELKYKVSGDIPIKYSAVDADGDSVPLITSLTKGVLTESVDAKSFTSLDKDKIAIKYPIKIDPTLTVQGEGQDTYLRDTNPNTNYGTEVEIVLGGRSGYLRNSLVLLPLTSLPAGAVISTSNLHLYYFGYVTGDPNGQTMYWNRLRRADWHETQSTWNIYKTSNDWGTAGAANTTTDIDTTYNGSFTIPAGYGWISNIDVKTLVEYSVTNSLSFNIRMHSQDQGSTTKAPKFYSKEYATDTSLRPKLVIEYSVVPDPPTNVAASENNSSKVIVTWTKSEGATGYKIYRDGNLIDTVGDVDTYDDTGADAPVITAGSAVASDGTSSAHVALSLSGTSIANGTTHSYTVKALNTTGDSAASSVDNGYRLAGTLTYQWQRSSADADFDYEDIDGATTASYNDTDAP